MDIMLDREFRVTDNRTNRYEVEIINLTNGNSKIAKVKADNSENAMQFAVEGRAVWMIGMTTSTLRDYYIEKSNILVKEPVRV